MLRTTKPWLYSMASWILHLPEHKDTVTDKIVRECRENNTCVSTSVLLPSVSADTAVSYWGHYQPSVSSNQRTCPQIKPWTSSVVSCMDFSIVPQTHHRQSSYAR